MLFFFACAELGMRLMKGLFVFLNICRFLITVVSPGQGERIWVNIFTQSFVCTCLNCTVCWSGSVQAFVTWCIGLSSCVFRLMKCVGRADRKAQKAASVFWAVILLQSQNPPTPTWERERGGGGMLVGRRKRGRDSHGLLSQWQVGRWRTEKGGLKRESEQ